MVGRNRKEGKQRCQKQVEKERGCWVNDRELRVVRNWIEVVGHRQERMSYVLGSMNGRRRK